MIKIEHENKHEVKKEHVPAKTPVKKKSAGTLLRYLVGASVLQVVLLVVIAMQLSNMGAVGGVAGAGVADNGGAALAPSPTIDMKALEDDDYVLGDKDAPVTIIEFSDYECPFCARFYSETLGQIKEKYVDSGKVKIIYRDFPLSFHAQAEPAAIAANCAGEQGKYYEYHDKIFSNGGSGGRNAADYKQWAQDLSLDIAKWETCLSDPAQSQEIQKDMQDGANAGVQGTPGFIVNGQLISGAQPFSVFEQVIEAELAN